MDDCLSKQINALKCANGAPDYQLRSAAFDNLVSFLLPDEMCALGERLRKELRRDIVSEVPLKILMLIADYLNFEELCICLHISKHWRAHFLEDRVAFTIVKRFLPSLTFRTASLTCPVQPQYGKLLLHATQAAKKRIKGTYQDIRVHRFSSWPDLLFNPTRGDSYVGGNSAL